MPVAQRVNRILRVVPAWPIYGLGFGWMGWLFWMGVNGDLGPEPINALERRYGLLALQLLLATLAITPIRTWTQVSLIKYRRALGLTAFAFLMAHVLVWAVLDLQSLSRIGIEILRRPYITLGFIGFVLLIPLAVTSNNAAIRRLGALGWKRLHRLTYPAILLGAIHFVWLVKGYPPEPFLYLAGVIALLALRLLPRRRPAPARAPAAARQAG